MRRRALLSAVAASSTVLAGCLGTDEPGGEGTTVEIIPTNDTDRRISLDVSVHASDGSRLLAHSYSLPPGHADESRGVPDRVQYLVVSLDGGPAVRHEYDPDVDICARDGEDVQIAVEPDGVSFGYSC